MKATDLAVHPDHKGPPYLLKTWSKTVCCTGSTKDIATGPTEAPRFKPTCGES